MPQIPLFETQGTPQIGARVAEIDPGAAGAPGAALAQAGSGVANVAQEFDRRYVEARRQVAAAQGVAAGAQQIGDAAFRNSKIPDRAQAYAGFQTEAAQIQKTILDGIDDPLVKAHVQGRLGELAVTQGLETQKAAFQLESSKNRGDLDLRLNQYAQSAASTNNEFLRAQYTDAANADIAGSVAAGWLHPEEGDQHKLLFASRIQQVAAEQERNAILSSRDPAAARAFAIKINDPASYPGLMPQEREVLGQRAELTAMRIEAEADRRAREDQALAIGRAAETYKIEASAIDSRGVGVMPPGVVRKQLLAAYGPEQGKALADDLDQRGGAYRDFQTVALTSPTEDRAMLDKYAQPSGGFNPQKAGEAQQIARAIEAKNQGLAADPAGYVQGAAPQVAALFQAAREDPAKLPAAVSAQDAVYDKLGVPSYQRPVLAKPVAQDAVARIQAAPPEQAADTIQSIAKTYGDLWPRVYGDLLKAKLPDGYQALAAIDDPVRRVDFAAALAQAPALKAALDKGEGKDIADRVAADGDMLALRASLADAPGGLARYTTFEDSAKKLAMLYAGRGMSAGKAVAAATDAFVGGKYDFLDNLRVPKGQGAAIDDTLGRTLADLKPADLAVLKPGDGVPADKAAQYTLDAARNGRWINNEQDDGALRVYRALDPRSGAAAWQPVMLGGGRRLEVKFKGASRNPMALPSTIQGLE